MLKQIIIIVISISPLFGLSQYSLKGNAIFYNNEDRDIQPVGIVLIWDNVSNKSSIPSECIIATDTLGYFVFEKNSKCFQNKKGYVNLLYDCNIMCYPTLVKNIPLKKENFTLNNIPLFAKDVQERILFVTNSGNGGKTLMSRDSITKQSKFDKKPNKYYPPLPNGDSIFLEFNTKSNIIELNYNDLVKFNKSFIKK